jgi:acyl-CoA dehydrogenase
MDFRHSERSQALQDQVRQFLDEQVYPAERDYVEQAAANRAAGDPFRTPDVLIDLKSRARSAGLWNLFLPDDRYGAGLSVRDVRGRGADRAMVATAARR